MKFSRIGDPGNSKPTFIKISPEKIHTSISRTISPFYAQADNCEYFSGLLCVDVLVLAQNIYQSFGLATKVNASFIKGINPT